MSDQAAAQTGAEPPAEMTVPHRRSRAPLWIAGVAGVLVLVFLILAGFAYMQVRRPLPQDSGKVSIPGLDASVSVYTDAQGVPQIYAETSQDLFRAQGYVQAQNYFFIMDYRRHVTSGTLAELVGDNKDAINADKVVRTLGWRRVAEQEWKILSPETKSYLQAYADGVNDYLANRSPGDTAVEYTILDRQVSVSDPAKWDPVDSLAWLKAMAWDLRGNYDEELSRARDYSTVKDVKRVDELFPTYPAQNHSILDPADLTSGDSGTSTGVQNSSYLSALSGPSIQHAIASTQDALNVIPQLVANDEGTGSNSWVVSGKYTASGKPLLANDPHLGLSVPGVWAQVGLHCTSVSTACPFNVAGFSFAGFPGVIIGHNGDLAWGLTNMGADVTDFFIERVRGDTYLRGDDWKKMDVRHETIKVNGSKSIDLEIRSTIHGPIISDVMSNFTPVKNSPRADAQIGDYEVALDWTALQPGHTADAVFGFDLAKNADDIRKAAAQFDVPAQNIVFATVDGHIGYQAPGRIPVRQVVSGPGVPVPSDGTWPRPGWDPRYDWKGWVDPAKMPRALDPKSGFIVAANQEVLPAGSGPYLTQDWDYGYRSERIRSLLLKKIDKGEKLTVADMQEIQTDDWSPYAQVLVPDLLDQEISSSFDAEGQKLLKTWNYHMDADSPAAAYFAAVWQNLLEITFKDDLPSSDQPTGSSRWLAVVQNLLQKPNDPYWDNRQTVSVTESRDEVLTKALVQARRDLTVELGKSTSDWSWGKLHKLELQHPVLGGSSAPWLVREFVNPDPIGVSGGSSVVDATSWDASSGNFTVTSGPSMRMVVDMSDLDKSTWVVPTGTSGHPASNHYTDQLDSWNAGKAYDWPFTRAAVKAAKKNELTLSPS